jgi:hypothetical protein
MPRSEQHRQAEHQVRGGDAGEAAGDLREDISRNFSPRQTTLRCIRDGDDRIKMSAGNWPECQNQGHQRRAGGQSVSQQSDGDVAIRQTLAHDA